MYSKLSEKLIVILKQKRVSKKKYDKLSFTKIFHTFSTSDTTTKEKKMLINTERTAPIFYKYTTAKYNFVL